MAVAAVQGQVEREYFARTPAYPGYRSPETARYNLKLGKLTAQLTGNVQAEFNDNVNLSAHDAQADFSVGPYLGIGFLWPLTRNHVMQLDMGLGYRWYLQNPAANSISVSPNTHLDYTILIGDVRLNLHDRFSIQVDPVSRGEISGQTGQVTAFRRLVNASGLSADWQATKRLELYGGYDFTLDRSLTSQFKSVDHDEHGVHAGLNYSLSARVKAGLLGSCSLLEYAEPVQNNGSSWSVGPTISVKLSSFLTATASGAYTVSSFSHTGTIDDRSGFGGFSYQIGLHQVLNRRTSQSLRVGESVGLGLGSNFSETFVVQYGLNTALTKAISLNGIVAYEKVKSSYSSLTLGERADRYLLYLGSGYQFTRYWSLGVSYSLALRDSALAGHDYLQNRLTLDLTRKF
jgi:hypothetical protein